MRTNTRALLALAQEVVEREGCEVPSIRWYYRDHPGSSGCTYTGSARHRGIALTLGTDHACARIVLLHELAHWLTPEDRGHGVVFWETAFRLYREAGIGWATIHKWECCSSRRAHKMHLASST